MYEIDNEKFGIFIAQLRKAKGMTQKALAQRLYVSDKAVSKWERGLSLPDIALLQPMADILGVTLTELLSGQYIQADEPFTAREVDSLVSVALSAQGRAAQSAGRRRWRIAYGIAAALGILGLAFFWDKRLWEADVVLLVLPILLAAAFGVHFCLLAKEILPDMYDKYKVNFYSDGIFRMDVLGVCFNNRNWPYILRAMRFWCVGMMAAWAPVYTAVHWVVAALCQNAWIKMAVLMAYFFICFFVSLFGPVYVLGKKYE